MKPRQRDSLYSINHINFWKKKNPTTTLQTHIRCKRTCFQISSLLIKEWLALGSRGLASAARLARSLQGTLCHLARPDFPHGALRNLHKICGKKNGSQMALRGSVPTSHNILEQEALGVGQHPGAFYDASRSSFVLLWARRWVRLYSSPALSPQNPWPKFAFCLKSGV